MLMWENVCIVFPCFRYLCPLYTNNTEIILRLLLKLNVCDVLIDINMTCREYLFIYASEKTKIR